MVPKLLVKNICWVFGFDLKLMFVWLNFKLFDRAIMKSLLFVIFCYHTQRPQLNCGSIKDRIVYFKRVRTLDIIKILLKELRFLKLLFLAHQELERYILQRNMTEKRLRKRHIYFHIDVKSHNHVVRYAVLSYMWGVCKS